MTKAKGGDVAFLDKLDGQLASNNSDPAAAELRATLLTLLPPSDDIPKRILAILDQASDPAIGKRATGYLLPLLKQPTDSQLDLILDGAQALTSRKSPRKYEIRHLFEDWFIRRLQLPSPISPAQLAKWLTGISVERSSTTDRLLKAIKARLEGEPTLFKLVYEELYCQQTFADEREQWLFIVHDVWETLPPALWPVDQPQFYLDRIRGEADAQRAANYFRMFLQSLPASGADISLTESAWQLIDSRPDLATALGDWTVRAIEPWRFERWKEKNDRAESIAKSRATNIAELTPHLNAIRDGTHGSLGWGADIYLGYCDDAKDASPDDRLLKLLDQTLTDAFIEGFNSYLDNGVLPTADDIIGRWANNRIPGSHLLVTVALYCSTQSNRVVPDRAHAACIAAAVTGLHRGDNFPGYDTAIEAWLATQTETAPERVTRILVNAWTASITGKRGYLPGLQDLEKAQNSARVLADAAQQVLAPGIKDEHGTVEQLVTLLLRHSPAAIPGLATATLAGNSASPEVVGIWSAAMLLTSDPNDASALSTLSSTSDASLWAAIDVLKSGRLNTEATPVLSSSKRAAIISVIGGRFANAGHPIGQTTYGHQNPWDAAEFVGHQIKAIAGDNAQEADSLLATLEADPTLVSYRDAIRHHRAQREKQVREHLFESAAPQSVASALANAAPANAADLLAYVEEHLRLLDLEIKSTSYERYQAYWNKNDRTFVSAKREEECSGLLAHDLQVRISPHNLIATVEHHMVADKECDVAVLLSTTHLLPIEVKHHYHSELWTAWRTQLDHLYTRDPKTGGLGIYCVLWSGTTHGRRVPKPPDGILSPTSAVELHTAIVSLIPHPDRARLRVVVIDISPIN